MKKFLLYVVLVSFCLSGFTQSSNYSDKKFGFLKKHAGNSAKNVSTADTFYKAQQLTYFYPDNANNNVWVKSSIANCSYNANALVTTEIYKDTTNTNSFYKSTYSYDNFWNQTERLSQNWNSSNSSWDNSYKHTSVYNTHNDQTENRDWNWDNNSNSWKTSYGRQTDYTYNSSNNVIVAIEKKWYNHLNSFRNESKIEDTYVNNILSEEAYSRYDTVTNSWIPEVKYGNVTWHNYATMQPSAYTVMIWNTTTGAWVNNEKFTTTYTGNNYVTLVDTNSGGNWVSLERETSNQTDNYGSYTNLLERFISGNWVNSRRYSIENNSHKEEIHYLEEKWQISWVTSYESKNFFTYDSGDNYLISEIRQYWDSQNSQLRNSNKIVYSNYLTIIGIREISLNLRTSIFPNPTSSELNISVDKFPYTVEIYNLLGQQMLIKTISSPESVIDMSSYDKGVYIINIKSDNKIENKRVVKE